MTTAEQLAELEEGFRHLVDGLREVAQTLEHENAQLRSRLDERRLMGPPTPQPLPVASPQSLPVVKTPPAYRDPVRRRLNSKNWYAKHGNPIVEKPCQKCHQMTAITKKAKFCPACRYARQVAHIVTLTATRSGRFDRSRLDRLDRVGVNLSGT